MGKRKITAILVSAALVLGLAGPGAAPLCAYEDILPAEEDIYDAGVDSYAETDDIGAEWDGESCDDADWDIDASVYGDAAVGTGGEWDAQAGSDLVEEAEEEPEDAGGSPAEENSSEAEEEPAADEEDLSGDADSLVGEEDLTGEEAACAPLSDEDDAAFREALMLADEEAEQTAMESMQDFRTSTKHRRNAMSGVNTGEREALYGAGQELAGDETLVGAADLPESFDLRQVSPGGSGSVSYVRKAPNQKMNGSCWAYAVTAAGESAGSAMSGSDVSGLDDSEAYLAYFAHAKLHGEGALEYTSATSDTLINPFLAGGTVLEAAQLLTSGVGPAAEGALPAIPNTLDAIDAAGGTFTEKAFDDQSLMAAHRITDVDFLPEPNLRDSEYNWTGHDSDAVLAIKEVLMSGRAVAADLFFSSGSQYIRKAENAVCVTDGSVDSNHQIAIIGWDDTFPAEAFAKTPEGDGAFLCRNSWGNYEDDYREEYEALAEKNFEVWKSAYLKEELHADTPEEDVTADVLARWKFAQNYPFDEDGIFYLSYYDRVYHSPMALSAEERGGSAWTTKLQYDYLGMSNCTNPEESEASGCEANVYALDEPQDLVQVAVFTAEAMSHVKAEIYLLSENAAGPTDGRKLRTEEADFRWAGYHILPISGRLTMPAGRFAAVVTITGSTGNPYTPFEYGGTDPWYPEYVYVTEDNEAGTSFILTDGGWVDLAAYRPDASRFYLDGAKAGNALIRAFTAAASGEPESPEEGGETDSGAGGTESGATDSGAGGTDSGAGSGGGADSAVIPASVTKRTFAPLKLRATSPGAKKIKLKWTRMSGDVSGYTLYGARYGKTRKKLADFPATSSSYLHKKLKKGAYYSYALEAYAMYGDTRVVLAKSVVVYAAAGGGTHTNIKTVKLSRGASGAGASTGTGAAAKIKSGATVRIKKGKTLQLCASYVKAGKSDKLKIYKKIRYTSSNSSVASVTKKGKVRAKKRGSARIYVYAQNGVYAYVKVKVT